MLVLAASACWDELVGGYAPARGRPALPAVPLCLSLGSAPGERLGSNLNRSLEALLLAYELGARLGESYRFRWGSMSMAPGAPL